MKLCYVIFIELYFAFFNNNTLLIIYDIATLGYQDAYNQFEEYHLSDILTMNLIYNYWFNYMNIDVEYHSLGSFIDLFKKKKNTKLNQTKYTICGNYLV